MSNVIFFKNSRQELLPQVAQRGQAGNRSEKGGGLGVMGEVHSRLPPKAEASTHLV